MNKSNTIDIRMKPKDQLHQLIQLVVWESASGEDDCQHIPMIIERCGQDDRRRMLWLCRVLNMVCIRII